MQNGAWACFLCRRTSEPNVRPSLPHTAGYQRSVLNVEGVAEGLVELDLAGEVEVADGFWSRSVVGIVIRLSQLMTL